MFASDAQQRRYLSKGRIDNPMVVGAVIDLGRCCNLLEVDVLSEMQRAHEYLATASKAAGVPLPQNKGTERGQRFMDKAVVDVMHSLRVEQQLAPYHTVRAALLEGEDLHDGGGFKARNHIQIAVLDTDCILGCFRPPGPSRR